ncbi:sigma-70 family RNA polymerase sigma factor [Streptomyces sp. I05A-00742]|uniref:RNA polymerase sigma factor n=1 Tax=Streptomyces sp. I05A-00742 TaxID=2732853 RepID=UPI00289E16F4|nr:sigma-70 family RNA polymerase sigma factor [Streptomyces sp. I05A-00742]
MTERPADGEGPMDRWPDADRVSFWAFHLARRKDYMRVAYAQLGSDADAEEAVDLAFEAVMRSWPRMLRMARLEQYAWTILKHRISDQRRRRRRRPAPMDTAAFEAALRDQTEDPYDLLTDFIQLNAAISSLSERQRDAVVLRYRIGYTTSEAAELLGIEEATVRSHVSQACRRLARVLEAGNASEPTAVPEKVPEQDPEKTPADTPSTHHAARAAHSGDPGTPGATAAPTPREETL